MLPLNVLVAATDSKVLRSLSSYRLAYLRDVNDTGWTRYEAVVYGGSKVAHPRMKVKAHSTESEAEVTCSCTYFAMNSEAALALHGNTKPVRTGGVLPMKRNPKLKPSLCPHLLLLALTVGKQWKEAETVPEEEGANVNPKLRTLR